MDASTVGDERRWLARCQRPRNAGDGRRTGWRGVVESGAAEDAGRWWVESDIKEKRRGTKGNGGKRCQRDTFQIEISWKGWYMTTSMWTTSILDKILETVAKGFSVYCTGAGPEPL